MSGIRQLPSAGPQNSDETPKIEFLLYAPKTFLTRANRMQIESTAAPSQDDGLYVSADACKLISLHAVSEIFRRDADEVVRNKNRSTVHPVSLL